MGGDTPRALFVVSALRSALVSSLFAVFLFAHADDTLSFEARREVGVTRRSADREVAEWRVNDSPSRSRVLIELHGASSSCADKEISFLVAFLGPASRHVAKVSRQAIAKELTASWHRQLDDLRVSHFLVDRITVACRLNDETCDV